MKTLFLKIIQLLFAIAVVSYGNMVTAQENDLIIVNKLRTLEATTDGRLGIFAINLENEQIIAYRANETFPTGCTAKVIGVAAVLNKSATDPTFLLTPVKYTKEELTDWSPITKQYVSQGMTIQELCAASISHSDNTAMNLLLRSIGGIQGMNHFARTLGDQTFRQDHDWPAEAFSGGLENVQDSSTPQAMVETLRKLTLGNALGSAQKDLLTTWLINTTTGSARIRGAIPHGWIVGNKTGTGAVYGSTNDLAIIWPPKHKPLLIGVYYTSANKQAAKREDVVRAATQFILEEFRRNDLQLREGKTKKF